MGTITSLMYTTLSALQADQAALDVTANNVANQNTVGYTREVVTFQSKDLATLNGSTGDGVTTGSGAVSQRNRVLEQQVQQQTQASSQSTAVEAAMEQIENVFGLSSTTTSASTTELGTAMDSFFSSLSSLASNPGDTSTRQSVLSAAGTLAAAFNSAASQLEQIGSGLDQQVTFVVAQVNSLTSTIANLNGQIAKLSPDGDAGTLEDQRQAAIASLSQYIGLNQITTENNGITLTTTGGALLVSGDTASALATTEIDGTTHVLAGNSGTDITDNISGGQLGGVISVRDNEIPSVMSSLDTLANAIATQVNAVNAQGLDGNGDAGQALFTTSSTVSGSAKAIAVATNDPQMLAAAATGEGSLGSGNATALADIGTATIAGGDTADSFYASLLDQVGNTAATATADSTQQAASLTQLTTQRDAVSGVSLDEEAANLTQYQRSYQAAAQVFAIVNSLLAGAINLGSQTTVS